MPTLQALLPHTDLNDRNQVLCIENKGTPNGNKGIRGLTPYYTIDLVYALNFLTSMLQNISKDQVLFIPTNQLRFAFFLEKLVALAGVPEDKIFTITSQTSREVQKALITDSRGYLEKNGYQVIIASPVFGTGFSIDDGFVSHTFGFIFTYPIGTSDWVQFMARARQPKSLFLYVQEASLGTSRKFSVGKRKYKIDTSWLAEKVMSWCRFGTCQPRQD